MTKRIGILTGGGDAPGLNPAIKYIVKKASQVGYETFGITDGWKGLLEPGIEKITDLGYDLQKRLEVSAVELIKNGIHEFEWKDLVKNASLSIAPLSKSDVSKWGKKPGTNLGSSRTNPFAKGNDRSKILIENIEKLGLDYIVALGGEDTQSVGYRLSDLGKNVIGIPKTIDGDLPGTDYTLGFRTAVGVIKKNVEIADGTARSHNQTTVVETMGRHSGLLAYEGAHSTNVGMVLIPEYSPSLEEIKTILMRRKEQGVSYDIILVSEGTKIRDYEDRSSAAKGDEFGHVKFDHVGQLLASDLEDLTDQKIRSISLGHLLRGADPNGYDIDMGNHFGVAAVELIEKGISGRMISYSDGKITHVPLSRAIEEIKTVNVEKMYNISGLNSKLIGFDI